MIISLWKKQEGPKLQVGTGHPLGWRWPVGLAAIQSNGDEHLADILETERSKLLLAVSLRSFPPPCL